MKTFNNEIVVHRNESFTIDKTVQNKDGSPYIISNKISNPYFLLTVSTTRYDQRDRYIKNYWLDLEKYPKFTSTTAIDLHSIKSTVDDNSIKYYTFESAVNDMSNRGNITGYVNGVDVTYWYNDAVFYIEKDGVRTYKYFNYDKRNWYIYQCRITKLFMQEDTREWVEQSYVYSIQLVSGTSMITYLSTLLKDNNIEYTENSDKETLIKLLKDNNIEIPIDYSRPISMFDTVITILEPTKLSVLSTIQGGL